MTKLLFAILVSISALFSIVDVAQAQKLGPTTPWLGWRPIGPRFGIHYSTMHIYPTDGASPYISPANRYEPAPPIAAATTYGQVRVLVPSADAKVTFDGAPTSSVGVDRLYYTPPLPADVPSTYRIRAAWTEKGNPMVQEMVVSVRPGETAVADFTSSRQPK